MAMIDRQIGRWGRRGALGTLVAIGGLAGFYLVDAGSIGDTSPAPIYLFAVVLAAFLGGVAGGVAAAAITVAHALTYLAAAGGGYTADVLTRIGVVVLTAPLVAVLVGMLRERLERAAARAGAAEAARAAADRLRESEQRYGALVQHAPVGILVHSGGSVVFGNDEAAAILRAPSPADLVGLHVLDLVRPDFHALVRERMRRLADPGAEGAVPLVEQVLVARDGSEVEVEAAATACLFDGKPAIQTVIRDISARKAGERALAQSERDYRGLFENAHDAILIFRPADEVVLEVNARACEVYGYAHDEFVGMPLGRISADPEAGRGHVHGTLEPGGHRSFRTRQRRRDGRELVLDVNATAIEYKGSAAILSVNRDVTERVRAEEDLRARKEMLQTIFEHMPAMVAVFEPGGSLTLVNRSWERVLGWPRDESRDPEVLGRIYPDPDALRAARGFISAGAAEWHDVRMRARDGRTLHARWAYVRLSDGTTIGIGRDITAERHAQAALRESEERLRLAQRAAGVGVFDWSLPDGRVLWSPELEAIYGLEPGSFAGTLHDWRSRIDPEYLSTVEATLRGAIARRAEWEVDFAIRRPGGERRWVHARGRVLPGRDGGAARVIGVHMDVTERRDAEEARRRSDARFRLLAEANVAGVALCDTLGRVTFANEEMLRIAGVGRPDLLAGRFNWRDATAPEHRQADESSMEELLAAGVCKPYQKEFLRPDGTRVPVWAAAALLDRATGEHVAMVVDLTELRRAEEALRERERLLNRITATTPAIIYIYDVHRRRNVYVNREVASILGYSAEDVRAMGPDLLPRLMHPEDIERFEAHLRRMDETPEGAVVEFEHRMRDRHGAWRWLFSRHTVFARDQAGSVTQILGTALDVTERRAAELAVRESESRLRRVVESPLIGIVFWEAGGAITDANDYFLGLAGAARDELRRGALRWDSLLPPENAALDHHPADELREKGFCTPYETEFARGDGRRIPVLVGAARLDDAGARGVGYVVDMTERKRLESDLRQAQKMEAVGLLASGVAHDFRNLIAAITGYTALAKKTLSADHPAMRSIERVEEAAEQAGGVTNALLTFSRHAPVERAPVELGAVVERVARLLRRTLPARIEFVTRPPPEPVWTVADAGQLQQVVLNLAINARDAIVGEGGPGRGRIEISVEADGAGPERLARLRVSDTGHGMTPEVRARAMEPYFTTKPPGEGTGLGLPIAHGIITDLGGRIEIDSAPDEGATLTVLLPAAPAPAAGREQARAKGQVALIAQPGRTAREIMAAALRSAGFEVAQADTGPNLLRERERLGPRVRLLVVNADLPDMGGLECLAAMRAGGDRTPAIVLVQPDGLEALDDPDAVPLVKPFQMTELGELAARVADRRDEERPVEAGAEDEKGNAP